MAFNRDRVKGLLQKFDFQKLFIEELGWDRHQATLYVNVDNHDFDLSACAQKRGFVVFICKPYPVRSVQLKIERQVTKSVHEHLIIFVDAKHSTQTWQWVKREPGKPAACRENTVYQNQSGEVLAQKLEALAFLLQEEEQLTLPDVTGRTRKAFDVEKVTKRFYERFKKEHGAFLKFVEGISAKGDKEWYASIMLNRLMFLYFIQKKGFLDNDPDYLRNRMKMVQQRKGQDKFLSFYRYFLLRLMHEGLGQLEKKRKSDLDDLIGKVPYLNGGIFEQHPLEKDYPEIDIPDDAFEKVFNFFDDYDWHLDERPLRNDKEINPDVLGYIFEKYINQKQMGAYYTKEDITEYISKNTVLPFLFDAARKKCRIAFETGSALWRLLSEDPDRYIYEAMKTGVIDKDGHVIPLPPEIEAGISDVSKRGNWNNPAGSKYALPTEIWREHVARRQRCLEIRQKLAKGEITEINDLITYNLDIRQFAQDVIENSEGSELLRAFYQAIEKITILDPACGSGAFLFAALTILEPLYEACLERMQAFVEELEHSEEKHRPEKYSDFRKVLDRVEAHPNQRYFVFKSIILNNLFGVDIMDEATEICKLRLFLKLVAQVDKVENVEPLPDIDFNIQAGNALVGFATYEDVKKTVTRKLDFDNTLGRIEEKAQGIDRLFAHFRLQQTKLGGEITFANKQQLRERLKVLEEELNHYLAGEYSIEANEARHKAKYDKWLANCKPFHWFIEFYGIMKDGGFDVIIGNPPYVEYSKVKKEYTIKGYQTENCGNLYAFIWERCFYIANSQGHIGMIVPVASVCTDRFSPLQGLLQKNGISIISNFNDRPSKLFDGLEHIRLSIILHFKDKEHHRTFSTIYNKWQSIERSHLFQLLNFVDSSDLTSVGAIAKIGSFLEASIIKKYTKDSGLVGKFSNLNGQYKIYYTRKLSHFVQIIDFIPTIRDEKGNKREPSELKHVSFSEKAERDVFLGLLNSSLFYWLLTVYSDCRNLNKREINSVRFNIPTTKLEAVNSLCRLTSYLMDDIKKKSKNITMNYKDLGALQIQCTYPKLSKSIIDKIDRILAQHYGFTDEELDFIINYDIKYRMGLNNRGGDNDEE